MNVLLLGLGAIARKHIHALRQIDEGVRLVALRHSVQSPAEEGIQNLYQWEEVYQAPQPFDFVIISTPTSEHLASIRQAIPLGIPLFIEKPLLHTLDGLEALERDIHRANIPTYVACNLRFLECITYLKQQILSKQPRINEINIYCGSYLPHWRPNADFRTIYSARPELGGGVHIDLIHELDYLYYLLGAPRHTRSTYRNQSSLHIEAIDYANYCLEYEGFCASVVLNYYRRDTKRQCEIVCEDGTYLIDLLSNTITRDNQLIFQSKQRIQDTYETQLRYFIDSLHQGRQLMNDVSEAKYIMEYFYPPL